MKYTLFSSIDKDLCLIYDNEQAVWFVGNINQTNLLDLSDTKSLVSLIRIFEVDPKEFFTLVLERIKNYNLPEKVLQQIPVKEALHLIINNKMHYWINKSLMWFDYLSFDEKFLKILSKLSYDKNYPQNIRQFVKKFLNSSNNSSKQTK
jgi:hypothetical protein